MAEIIFPCHKNIDSFWKTKKRHQINAQTSITWAWTSLPVTCDECALAKSQIIQISTSFQTFMVQAGL